MKGEKMTSKKIEDILEEKKARLRNVLERKRNRLIKKIKLENARKIAKLEKQIEMIKNYQNFELALIREQIKEEEKDLILALEEDFEIKEIFESVKLK